MASKRGCTPTASGARLILLHGFRSSSKLEPHLGLSQAYQSGGSCEASEPVLRARLHIQTKPNLILPHPGRARKRARYPEPGVRFRAMLHAHPQA
ncbi:hypothetical protein PsYK624_049720 [Phanerochaete sordida]|uniref:Uncharacterized protein n=1 Tax=Phanerochaete sordida TaxID=48140 RepID=A0A9P3LB56_9APHY|nr:hypothetical protein PsYK624_049720 [Phanerochaete sordida]